MWCLWSSQSGTGQAGFSSLTYTTGASTIGVFLMTRWKMPFEDSKLQQEFSFRKNLKCTLKKDAEL